MLKKKMARNKMLKKMARIKMLKKMARNKDAEEDG